MVRSLVGLPARRGVQASPAPGVGGGDDGGDGARSVGEAVVPAHGLTLEEVGYQADVARASSSRPSAPEHQGDDPADDPEDHYSAADPSVPFWRESPDGSVWGHELYPLISGAGVFTAARLDPGTAVLLREAELPARNRRAATSAAGTA